jgi:peptide/nickel transport system permease protein
MLTFVIRRIALSIPVLLVASMIVFGVVRATTDPLAKFSQSRDPNVKTREALRIGLQQEPCTKRVIELSDGPHEVIRCQDVAVPVQYARYMRDLAHLDLGNSKVTGRPASTELKNAFSATLQLIFWGVVISALIAVAVGVYSAVRQYSIPDYVLTGLTFLGISTPPFVFGLLAIDIGCIQLTKWLGLSEPVFYSIGLHRPNGGLLDYARHLVLPVATLTVQIVASWARFQRSSMLDVLGADYMRTARAKGLSRTRVVLKHGLRNGLIPLVTVMAIDIGALFGGLIITEQIFSIPGMGKLFFTSLQNGDVNILLPWLLTSAVFIVLFNLLADVLYGALDPRIRIS